MSSGEVEKIHTEIRELVGEAEKLYDCGMVSVESKQLYTGKAVYLLLRALLKTKGF